MAGKTLERIRRNIIEATFPQVGKVTVSIGYTMMHGKEDHTKLIDRADRALYHAKEKGRNLSFSFEHLVEKNEIKPLADNIRIDIWDDLISGN
jgi:PleD family two-component response regulator